MSVCVYEGYINFASQDLEESVLCEKGEENRFHGGMVKILLTI